MPESSAKALDVKLDIIEAVDKAAVNRVRRTSLRVFMIRSPSVFRKVKVEILALRLFRFLMTVRDGKRGASSDVSTVPKSPVVAVGPVLKTLRQTGSSGLEQPESSGDLMQIARFHTVCVCSTLKSMFSAAIAASLHG